MALKASLKYCHERNQNLQEGLKELIEENQQLMQQLQTTGNFAQPDYEAARDRALARLKTGRQSTAGKAIDGFIKELKSTIVPQ
ncbi:MAG: hypothetical protein V7L04_17155 [Nostoc sp.]|uniref:hypothetical protein n=1 Tax=Nostoc sp. TaxID=1180 RepID=UPI002FF61D65